MSFTFKQALEAFKNDKIRELGNDPAGQRFLKLRSMSRKDLMERLFQSVNLPIPNKPSKFWLQLLFNSRIPNKKIEQVILEIYNESRASRLKVERRNIMIYTIDEKSEKEFSEWMESISFVDKDFNPLPIKLTKDMSEDLEDDRQ